MPPAPSAADPLPGNSPSELLVHEGAAPAFSPLYQQIKTLILQSLESGEWKPGESLPSEFDLALRFRVSQGTVRKAIDELSGDNLLVRRQGKGTFVATHSERRVQYRFLKLRSDSGQSEASERKVLACKRVRAPADVARALQLRSGEAVVQARRILTFDGIPRVLEDIWLPGQTFKGLTAAQLADYKGPTYAMFELEFGVRMVRADEKLRAVSASADQALSLAVEPGTPLMSVERLSYTYNDSPMELRRGFYRTDSHHYHNQLN